MPVSGLSRLERLLAEVVLLQRRRRVSLAELRSRFAVSERTLYRDLASLQRSGIPLSRDSLGGYFLAPGARLRPLMLNEDELSSLALASSLAEGLADRSVLPGLTSAMEKIRSMLPAERGSVLDGLGAAVRVTGASAARRHWLGPIRRALLDRRLLRITYRSGARREQTRRDVEPLGLLFYGEHWHLLGYCRLRDAVRDFRVDRITALTERDGRFPARSSELFEGCWARLLTPADGTVARVRTTAEWRDLLYERSHYWVVDETSQGEEVVLTYVVPSLDILARWLLSYSSHAEAIEPPLLRKRLAELARQIATQYHGTIGADLR